MITINSKNLLIFILLLEKYASKISSYIKVSYFVNNEKFRFYLKEKTLKNGVFFYKIAIILLL